MVKIQPFEAAKAKALNYLLVMSNDVNEADGILKEEIPNWTEIDYKSKMTYLKDNFSFNLSECRFTLENDPDKIAREDYFATLQYLISEARACGVKSVIKTKS